MNLYEVLRRPLITEKSTRLSESNKYVFEVDKKASKDQVRQAVEKPDAEWSGFVAAIKSFW